MKKKLLALALIPLFALTGCKDDKVNLDDFINELQPGKLPENAEQLEASQVYEDLQNQETPLCDAISVEVKGLHASMSDTVTKNGVTTIQKLGINNANAYFAVKGLTSATNGSELETAAKFNASFEVKGFEGTETEATQHLLDGKTLEMAEYIKDSNMYLYFNEEFDNIVGQDIPNKMYQEIPFDQLVENGELSFPILTEESLALFVEEFLEELQGSTSTDLPTDLPTELPDDLPLTETEMLNFSIELMDIYFDFSKVDSTYFISFSINSSNLVEKLNSTLDLVYEYGLLEYYVGEQISNSYYEQYKESLKFSFMMLSSMFKDVSFSVAYDPSVGLRKLVYNLDLEVPVYEATPTSSTIYEEYINIKSGATVEFKYGSDVVISYPDFSDYTYVDEDFEIGLPGQAKPDTAE